MIDDRRPAGIKALSILFVFGAFMSGMSAILLLFPGSIVDGTSNAGTQPQQGFSGMGSWTLPLMTLVCLACIAAAVGLWRLAPWGLWTAVVILGANVVGDAIGMFSSHDWRTLLGLLIFGFMIWYLLRSRPLFEGIAQTAASAEDQSAHTSA
jgi:hypothetical protein